MMHKVEMPVTFGEGVHIMGYIPTPEILALIRGVDPLAAARDVSIPPKTVTGVDRSDIMILMEDDNDNDDSS